MHRNSELIIHMVVTTGIDGDCQVLSSCFDRCCGEVENMCSFARRSYLLCCGIILSHGIPRSRCFACICRLRNLVEARLALQVDGSLRCEEACSCREKEACCRPARCTLPAEVPKHEFAGLDREILPERRQGEGPDAE